MIIEACQCDGLPAHDHFAGHERVNGVWRTVYSDGPARIWVDWKAVARALMQDREGSGGVASGTPSAGRPVEPS